MSDRTGTTGRGRARRAAPTIATARAAGSWPTAQVEDCVEGPLVDSRRNKNRKYQYMESNMQRKAAGLKDKIPDIQKTLETVQFLKTRTVCHHAGLPCPVPGTKDQDQDPFGAG